MERNVLIPYVVERTSGGERSYDLYSRLLEDPHHLPRGGDRRRRCKHGRRPAHLPRSEGPRQGHQPVYQQPGRLRFGGSCDLRHDELYQVRCSTICIGMAASMAAFLLSSGAKGKRFALKNSEVMIHQPLGGAQGQASDINDPRGTHLKDQGQAQPHPCGKYGGGPSKSSSAIRTGITSFLPTKRFPMALSTRVYDKR